MNVPVTSDGQTGSAGPGRQLGPFALPARPASAALLLPAEPRPAAALLLPGHAVPNARVAAPIAPPAPAAPPRAPAPGEMAAVLAAAAERHSRAGAALRIRRYESDEGPAFWRWDCARCGEYGGGRHHPDAITRALRHCAEHPQHRSSLLPPTRCRERVTPVAVHPMLFAVDDDPPPPPLSL